MEIMQKKTYLGDCGLLAGSESRTVPRRGFMQLLGMGGGYLLMFGASAVSFLAGGCNVFEDILAWVPVANAGITAIQVLLGALVTPLIIPIFTAIKTALSDLSGAVSAYQNDTNAADKATSLAKVGTFLADITSNFQNLLSALPLGGIVSLVIGLVQVILTTIAGFVTKLPAAAGTSTMQRVMMAKQITFQAQTMQIPAIYRDKNKFRSDWNSLCTLGGHPEAEI